jgi:hypothetical protein
MSAVPAAKRARPPALDAAVSTLEVPPELIPFGLFVMADANNHAIRVVTPGGTVRTLAGNGEAGFADGQGAAARFKSPTGLARDKDGSILVADSGNNAVRRDDGGGGEHGSGQRGSWLCRRRGRGCALQFTHGRGGGQGGHDSGGGLQE